QGTRTAGASGGTGVRPQLSPPLSPPPSGSGWWTTTRSGHGLRATRYVASACGGRGRRAVPPRGGTGCFAHLVQLDHHRDRPDGGGGAPFVGGAGRPVRCRSCLPARVRGGIHPRRAGGGVVRPAAPPRAARARAHGRGGMAVVGCPPRDRRGDRASAGRP